MVLSGAKWPFIHAKVTVSSPKSAFLRAKVMDIRSFRASKK